MDHVLTVFVLLWSSGLQTKEHNPLKDVRVTRLVGRRSRCSALLERDGRSTNNDNDIWDLKSAAVVCRQLDCGSVVQVLSKFQRTFQRTYASSCLQPKSNQRKCLTKRSHLPQNSLEITCSDSVRLLNGTSLCSGRLEVKSNQSWSSVCDDDFNLQEAEVVCRQLGCGAPLVFQGGLYGELKASVWSKEFQCEGNESALLDCDSSDSARNTCSPGKAVGLTCSELDNVRLSGGTSRCDGRVEMKREEWRPLVTDNLGDQDVASVVCRQLGCGSVVSAERTVSHSPGARWFLRRPCGQSDSNLRDCLLSKGVKGSFSHILQVICSDILVRPIISFAACNDGVSEANRTELQVLMGSRFTISCSIQPQFQGGSFQLILTTSAVSQNFTLPAVNHSARFLFSAAVHTHQGDYRCVYHVCVFNHNFSSASQQLSLTVSGHQRAEAKRRETH